MASRCSYLAIAALALVGAAAPARPLARIAGKIAISKVSVGSKVDGFDRVVVYLEDVKGVPLAPSPQRYEIVQHDKHFEPDFLVVPQGADVAGVSRIGSAQPLQPFPVTRSLLITVATILAAAASKSDGFR